MNEYTIFFIVPIATIIALFIYFMFFYNKKNKIEIYIKGATGNEEFQIQDLQKNIIINKKTKLKFLV